MQESVTKLMFGGVYGRQPIVFCLGLFLPVFLLKKSQFSSVEQCK